MDPIKIRPIIKSDNGWLSKIVRSVFEEFNLPKTGTVYSDPTTDDLYGLFQVQGAICFVAGSNNEIVGSGGIFPTKGLPKGFCEFSKFYICPKARGKGIGKLIILECIGAAKELGYHSIYLESFPELNDALGMYKNLGFKLLTEPLGCSGHYACTVWMVYQIKQE